MITNVRYGKPCSYDYEILLDHFSGLNTNSIRTSTIPLVQFWKDTNQRTKQLLDALKESTNSVTLCFEYPTVSPKGHGKASMTDLMVICGNSKIAIEAKFTEYLPENGHPENIEGWLQKGTSDNRQQVLEGWTSLIEPFSQGINPQLQHSLDYQFYHRTASACAGSEAGISATSRRPARSSAGVASSRADAIAVARSRSIIVGGLVPASPSASASSERESRTSRSASSWSDS